MVTLGRSPSGVPMGGASNVCPPKFFSRVSCSMGNMSRVPPVGYSECGPPRGSPSRFRRGRSPVGGPTRAFPQGCCETVPQGGPPSMFCRVGSNNRVHKGGPPRIDPSGVLPIGSPRSVSSVFRKGYPQVGSPTLALGVSHKVVPEGIPQGCPRLWITNVGSHRLSYRAVPHWWSQRRVTQVWSPKWGTPGGAPGGVHQGVAQGGPT